MALIGRAHTNRLAAIGPSSRHHKRHLERTEDQSFMLRHLEIRDILLIDHLVLELQPGLNVLTGETGAGKSILLDCLGFVLGWRGRAELVRQGCKQGEVIAVFELAPDHPVQTLLESFDLGTGDELILRRLNTSDGRKTAYVNDRRVRGEILRQIGDQLVELHGQHDDRGLLDSKGHQALLDSFAGLQETLAQAKNAWNTLRTAQKALEAAQSTQEKLRADEDYLRHSVAELEQLSPQPGEEATLDQQRRLMQSAARISEDIAKAARVLGNDGAEGLLMDATRWLEGAADHAEGRLEGALITLARARHELADAESAVRDVLDTLSFDPNALEEVEDRLFAIRGLARKYSIAPDELNEFAQKQQQALNRLDDESGDVAACISARDDAQAQFTAIATTLHDARVHAAKRLDIAMAKELAPLKMERARFATQITEAVPGPAGYDDVAFTAATNPGAPAGAINKIASGGELSRFLLALKVCLTQTAQGQALIFDEIDRGVGGATADAVGRRLAALAKEAQVLVVTHSPQVAALGGHHWRVSKRVSVGQTLSTITPLDDAARIDELARMLAGDTITDEARAAARVLLAG